jgi:rod shape determining protein RodA
VIERFRDILKTYDFSFFLGVLSIFVIGILNLYSATHTDNNPYVSDLYKSQIMWFLLATCIGFTISLIDIRTIAKFSYFLYFSGVFILILTYLIGDISMGARRWLEIGPLRIQPSEFMKIILVLALAKWFSRFSPDEELNLKTALIPALIAFIPSFLIIIQPDLGTGSLLLIIFLIICFYRRLKWSSIIKIVILGIIGSGIMYKYGLKEYQRKRIETFFNPYKDAKGSGYNAIQSEIAIGSGRMFGKGYMKSSQASLNFLPENHTDFVFSIFNEEHGLFGSMLLICLYLILFLRLVWLAKNVTRIYDSILVIGVLAILFAHTFINMAMVTGLIPIVGIPLPLMSYGGSSLITLGVSMGLVTSISNSRNLFVGTEYD